MIFSVLSLEVAVFRLLQFALLYHHADQLEIMSLLTEGELAPSQIRHRISMRHYGLIRYWELAMTRIMVFIEWKAPSCGTPRSNSKAP